ncbi:MAG: cyclase family protein, partial [Calditrichaeota bacterium]
MALLIVLAFSMMMLPGCGEDPGEAVFQKGRWIDLTHSFSEETIYWPTARPFEHDTVHFGETPAGYFYAAYNFCAAEHGGTHMDAPIHFAKGQRSADQVPLGSLIGPAVVVNVADKAQENRDYQVSVNDLENWEKVYGPIPKGAIVLLNTGYAKYWPDAEKYMGTAERGQEAVAKLHFPGLHPDAAKWLTQKEIAAVGLDTPSIDYGQSTQFESHQILFKANIPAFENVANISEL